MRIVRSLLCAGLAMMAMAVCASMPAAAAVPVDIGVSIQTMTAKEYPAPAGAIVCHDVEILPSALPAVGGDSVGRSTLFASSTSFASTPFTVNPYQHIDPDIAG